MAGPTENLIVKAFELSRACPREWEEFMAALDAYVADTVKKLMTSELSTLANYQGQAVQAQHIYHLLSNARETMQNAERMRSAKPKVEKTQWPSK